MKQSLHKIGHVSGEKRATILGVARFRCNIRIAALVWLACAATPVDAGTPGPDVSVSQPRTRVAQSITDVETPTSVNRGRSARGVAPALGCTISVSPAVVLKPGEPLRLKWTTTNAATARIEGIGPVPVGDDNARDLAAPSRTTTYEMFVSGSGGNAACRTSVAVPERTQPLTWPPQQLAALPADYLARARETLSTGIARANLRHEQGWVFYATASLMFEQDSAAINAYLADRWRMPAHERFGFGLFSLDYMRLYALFHAQGPFRQRLSEKAQASMLDQMFAIVSQTRHSEFAFTQMPGAVSRMRGSENHFVAAASSNLLASQFLKNTTAYQARRYEDGRLPEQHYTAWNDYLSAWLDERVRKGMYVEVGSPSYEDETRQAVQNLRDFAEDPVLRKKAEMFLDLTYAIIAEETINGVRGGAKSRVYSFRDTFWRGGEDRSFNLIFDAPRSGYKPLQNPAQATSSYFPPQVILDIGKDVVGRGTYEFIERRPGVGTNERDVSVIDPLKSVYRYGFASPTYILGSFGLDFSASYLAPSGQNRWQGLILGRDAEARIAPQITRLRRAGELDREQRVRNGFAAVQDRNVLIVQRSGQQEGYLSRTDVYLSAALEIAEESGWIFARAGDSFAAIKVVAPVGSGYSWLDRQAKNKAAADTQRYIVLNDQDSPVIIIAGDALPGTDFEQFKTAVKTEPISYDRRLLRFSGLTYDVQSKTGTRNGAAVEFFPARVYDSPFIRSDWNSGVVFIRKGASTLKLDFSNPRAPEKTIGGPATPDFPPGIGTASPIRFAPP